MMFRSNLQTPAVRRVIGVGTGWAVLLGAWALFVLLTLKVNPIDVLDYATDTLEGRMANIGKLIGGLGAVHLLIALLNVSPLPTSRR